MWKRCSHLAEAGGNDVVVHEAQLPRRLQRHAAAGQAARVGHQRRARQAAACSASEHGIETMDP